MKHLKYVAVLAFLCLSIAAMANSYEVSSPDGHLRAEIRINSLEGQNLVEWRLHHDETVVLDWSPIGLDIRQSAAPETPAQVVTDSICRTLQPQLYVKRSHVQENCRMLTLDLDLFAIEWRVFNDGAAYRFVLRPQEDGAPIRVLSETVDFRFAGDYDMLIPYENDRRGGTPLCFSFESFYDHQRFSEMFIDSLCITPLCVSLPGGKRVLLAESDVQSYPGLFLMKGEDNSLRGKMAQVPVEQEVGGWQDYNLIPTRRADYIAQWNDAQEHRLPWRIVGVFADDKQILNSDLVYLLASESMLDDASWIRPGQSVWDWWNDWNLEGVDFQPGINNQTYEYYADFASQYAIPYLIVDDGWSTHASLMDVKDGFSVPALVDYAAKKNVSVILWASYRALMSNLEGQMAYYANLGVKGFKVDFFDRDDQLVINDIERMAACAAKHHLILDLHGFKPTGIQRRWPNVVSFEGVKGLENFKWEVRVGDRTQHDHPLNVIEATFLRGFVGPMDYTPGSMNNATYQNFRRDNHNPMSIGTRCNQLAMFVVMETPFQMLADSPTRYEANAECTSFLSRIPTTFDETVVLDARLGEYIVIARRKGSQWYLGALTNEPRTIEIDCSFLSEGRYAADLFVDTSKSRKDATAYTRKSLTLTSSSRLRLKLAYAGGAAAILTPLP